MDHATCSSVSFRCPYPVLEDLGFVLGLGFVFCFVLGLVFDSSFAFGFDLGLALAVFSSSAWLLPSASLRVSSLAWALARPESLRPDLE
jgi:hypothetical protein